MSDEIFFDGVRYVSAHEAALSSALSQDYIARLAKEKRVVARRVGRQWYINQVSLKSFLIQKEYDREQRRKSLTRQRSREYQRNVSSFSALPALKDALDVVGTHGASRASAFTQKMARAVASNTTSHAAEIAAAPSGMAHAALQSYHVPVHAITPAMEFVHKLAAITLAFMLTFGTYTAVDPRASHFATDSARDVFLRSAEYAAAIGSLASGAQAQFAAAADNPGASFVALRGLVMSDVPRFATTLARSVNAGIDSLLYGIAFPSGLTQSQARVAVEVQPYALPVRTATSSAVQPARSYGPTIVNPVTERVIERVRETQRIVSVGGLTEEYLNTKLQELDNKLSGKIYEITAVSSPPASGGFTNTIALSTRIDRLLGTTITNPTITGGSITGTTIAGSSVGATALSADTATLGTTTISGSLSVTGTFTPSGLSTFPNGFISSASSTIGDGTESGGLTISGGATTTGTLISRTDDEDGFFINAQNQSSGTTAGTRLLLKNDTGIQTRLGITSSAYSPLNGLGPNNAFFGTLAANALTLYNNSSGGYLNFLTGLSDLERMRITTTGNVGIGTTSPYARLSVAEGTSGTVIAADTLAGFSGTLLDLKVASSSVFSVNQNGGFLALASSTINGNLVVTGDATTTNATSSTLYLSGTIAGAGLTTCSGALNKLTYNATTKQFVCATEQGGGGSDVNWTYFNGSGILVSTTTNQVLIGGSSTTTLSRLEVIGGASIDNSTTTNATTTSLFATTASSTRLFTSNLSVGALSGFLKATAGAVATALVNLASDVSGVLPVGNGGTGWAAVQSGSIPYGNGSSALATTSAGTAGYVLAYLNGIPAWVATTTLSTISGTLAVSKGGTGVTSFTANRLLYSDSAGSALAYAATSSLAVGNGLTTTSGTLGYQVGGTDASIGLAAIAANSILANQTGAAAVPTALATSSLFTGTNGQLLARVNGTWTGVATTTFSTGLTYAAGNVTCDTASGSVFGCLSSADWSTFNSKLGSYDAWTHPLSGWSATTSIIRTGGLYATASSTIGDGTQAGGLTISGGATTTGSLAITGTSGTTSIASGQGFSVGSTQFVVNGTNGRVGIGTAAPTTGLDIDTATDISGDLTISGGSTLTISATGPINQTGTGQVTFGGNVDATNGLDVTTGNLTVGANKFTVAPSTGNTTIAGTLTVDGAIAGSSTLQITSAARAYSTLRVDNTLTAAGSGTGLSVTNNASVGGTLAVTGNTTMGGTLAVTGELSAATTTIAGDINLSTKKITGLASPTAASDAANKTYVDSVAQGLSLKESVRAGTTANITLSGEQTVDGVALVAGDRVLVKNQSDQTKNGIYVVAAGTWSRSTDADTSAEVVSGLFTFVSEGTVNSSSGWVLTTADPITLETSLLVFTQFSGAGQIIAGSGLTKSGNTLDVVGTSNRITVNADSIDISSNYVGQTSITTVGTLTSGSLGSGFGNIDIGASTITAGQATFSSIVGSAITGSGNLTINGTGSFTGNVSVSGNFTAATTTFSGDVALGGKKITGLADPTSAQEAATKAYVDAIAQGLTVKASVRVATTSNITLSGTQTIDGVAAIAGNRVLVMGQSTASQNGIYVVAAGAWSRSTDADTNAEVISGMYAFVEEGTENVNTGWSLITANPITLDTTALTFTQFSGSSDVTAGDGLTKTGTTLNAAGTANRISVSADAIDISTNYIGQSSITTVGTLTTGAIGSGFGAINIGASALTAGAATFASAISYGTLSVGATATTSIVGNSATSTFSGGISLASGNVNLPTGGLLLLNNTHLLSATTLGSSVVSSSLTSVGALDSGSITTGFGTINIGSDTLDAGTTTIKNLVVQNTSSSTFAGPISATQLAVSSFNAGSIPFFGAGGYLRESNSALFWNAATSRMGLGTTTPWGNLSIQGTAGQTSPLFQVGSSSVATSYFTISGDTGFVGIATSSASSTLAVHGNALFSGNLSLANINATGTITSTATTANTFPYASSTALSVSGMSYLSGGLLALASSTIGGGTQAGGLTISGGATTTGSTYLATVGGSVGVGTTTPWGLLSVNADGISGPAFVVGSSTVSNFIVTNAGKVGIGTTSPATHFSISAPSGAFVRSTLALGTQYYGTVINTNSNPAVFWSSAHALRFGTSAEQDASATYTEYMRISSSGSVGIGTTSPWTKLALHANNGETNTTLFSIGSSTASATTTLFSISNTGTTTAVNGFNITDGCFAIDNTCLSTGGSTNSAGGTGAVQFANSTSFAGDGAQFFWDSTNNRLGIGTTSPSASLSIHAGAASTTFAIGSTTSSYFMVTNTGRVGIGTTSPIYSGATEALTLGGGTTGRAAWLSIDSGTDVNSQLRFYQGSVFKAAIYTTLNDGKLRFYTGSDALTIDSTSNVGVGTTTPWGLLSVNPNGVSGPAFVVGSSTATNFIVTNGGNVGFGTTTPWAQLSVNPNGITGPAFAIGSSTSNYFMVTNGGSLLMGTTSQTIFSITPLVVTSRDQNASTAQYLTNYTDGSLARSVFGAITNGGNGAYLLANSPSYTQVPNWHGSSILFSNQDALQLISSSAVSSSSIRFKVAGNGAANEIGRFTSTGLGIGTTSPWTKLSVHANNGGTATMLFAIGSSTASATTTLFSVSNSGVSSFGDSSGTGDAVMQFASDSNAWVIGYKSSDKSFNIASSTNLTGTAALSIAKNGTVTIAGPSVTCVIGNGTSATNCSSSDERLKTNISTLTATSGLAAIEQLKPVSFNWNDWMQSVGAAPTTQFGFIAQDVASVFPSLVTQDVNTGYYKLDYQGIIPPIVKAVQELDAKFTQNAGRLVMTDGLSSTTTIDVLTGVTPPDKVAPWAGIFADASQALRDGINALTDTVVKVIGRVIYANTALVQKLFAKEVHTDKLCASKSDGTEVCVTGDQLAAMLSGQTASAATAAPGGSAPTTGDTTTTSTSAPVIAIGGNNPAIVNVGDTYNDLGAVITAPADALNLGITASVDGTEPIELSAIVIDTSIPGTHSIEYRATNTAGQTGTATRTVEVVAPNTDTTTTAPTVPDTPVDTTQTATTTATSTTQ